MRLAIAPRELGGREKVNSRSALNDGPSDANTLRRRCTRLYTIV